jgi:hypothetical protein
LLAQIPIKLPDPPPGFTNEQILRISYTIVFVLGIIYCGALGILGMFVRRGGKIAAIFASILCALAVIYFAFEALVAAVVAVVKNPSALIDCVLMFIPVGLFAVTLIWLIQLLRSQSPAPQMQVQNQYGGMQQPPPQYSLPPDAGSPANFTPPPTGYGSVPTAPPSPPPQGQQTTVRHPPLPPDQPNSGG